MLCLNPPPPPVTNDLVTLTQGSLGFYRVKVKKGCASCTVPLPDTALSICVGSDPAFHHKHREDEMSQGGLSDGRPL